MSNNEKYGTVLLMIALVVIPFFTPQVQAATIGNSSYGVDSGNVLTYDVVEAFYGPLTPGDKWRIEIDSVYRSDIEGFYGATINASISYWLQSTGEWNPQAANMMMISHNATTRDYYMHPSVLFVLPTPMNLSRVSYYFNVFEEQVEDFNASWEESKLSVDVNGSIEYTVNYTYNSQGIAIEAEGGANRVIINYAESIIGSSNKDTSISFGGAFLGITVVSSIALLIKLRRKHLIRKEY